MEAGTWAQGLDVDRVSVAAGPVVLIKVGILPHAASPGKGQGMARSKVVYHLHQRDKWVVCTGQMMRGKVQTCSQSTW